MSKAHILINGEHKACSKSCPNGQLSWDVSVPNASICKTCFNRYSKSGNYALSECVGITVLEMSRISLMSV